MMKIETTKNWLYKPAKNLVKSIPIEDDEKLYNERMGQHFRSFVWQDMLGLSWIFIDDEAI